MLITEVNVAVIKPVKLVWIIVKMGPHAAMDSFTKMDDQHAQNVLMTVPSVVLPRRAPLVKQLEQVFLPSHAVVH